MFKLNKNDFCALCGCHTDHKDLYYAEVEIGGGYCDNYHACGLCKEILEDNGLVDEDGYMILSREQINALENGSKIIQGGAVIKIWGGEAAA